MFYMQYFCELDADELKYNNLRGLTSGLLYLLIVFIITEMSYFAAKISAIENKQWHYKLITGSNFSIEMKVTPLMWKNFKDSLAYDIDN